MVKADLGRPLFKIKLFYFEIIIDAHACVRNNTETCIKICICVCVCAFSSTRDAYEHPSTCSVWLVRNPAEGEAYGRVAS